MVVTDTNGGEQSHTGEILQLKTPSEVIDGESGSFSIKIDNLKPNTSYENMFSIRWYNPKYELSSEYVNVPSFKTLMVKPVNIDSTLVEIETFPDHVIIKDSTTRDLQIEEATLKAFKVSDGSIVASSSDNTITIPDLTMTTEYLDQYGIYWENNEGKSNDAKPQA